MLTIRCPVAGQTAEFTTLVTDQTNLHFESYERNHNYSLISEQENLDILRSHISKIDLFQYSKKDYADLEKTSYNFKIALTNEL